MSVRNRQPGDLSGDALIARIIRVDQAGELGAKYIYDGQLAVLQRSPGRRKVAEMAEQEQAHLDTFNRLAAERHVRPSILDPLWRISGFALGAGTALLGEKAAMACTVAVEEVIDAHYGAQSELLDDDESELRDIIDKFRVDEQGHRDIGLENGAEEAPFYGLLTGLIKRGARTAIWLAERF